MNKKLILGAIIILAVAGGAYLVAHVSEKEDKAVIRKLRGAQLRELMPEAERDRISSEYRSSIIDLYPTFNQDPFASLSSEEENFIDTLL